MKCTFENVLHALYSYALMGCFALVWIIVETYVMPFVSICNDHGIMDENVVQMKFC